MLNLITDHWIPVRLRDGTRRLIAPWEIRHEDIVFPDWPRPDFNLACLELLIGLVYLTSPPDSDRGRRRPPSEKELKSKMINYAHAFNLQGKPPLFLQDYNYISEKSKKPDMLFIDSAGEESVKKNTDVMTHRDRYPGLDPEMAAMALYTLQSFAPAGGSGNQTSMRGGGPLVTLVKPEDATLWDIIWMNMPTGAPWPPQQLEDVLPWMRKLSKDDSKSRDDPMITDTRCNPEVFFGQPRRLQLVFDQAGMVIGIKQQKGGNNYKSERWRHPLSPYYYRKDKKVLPQHPRPGRLTYASWPGIAIDDEKGERAEVVKRYERSGDKANLLIGGWVMKNMSPQDFQWIEVPLWHLDKEKKKKAIALIRAGVKSADALGKAILFTKVKKGNEPSKKLTKNVKELLKKFKKSGEPFKEVFFGDTERRLIKLISEINGSSRSYPEIAQEWLSYLHDKAMALFDQTVSIRMLSLGGKERQAVFDARKKLLRDMKNVGLVLDLPLPNK